MISKSQVGWGEEDSKPEKAKEAKEAKRCSQTGTRTRVCWVRASHPNHLDYLGSRHTNTHTQTQTPHKTQNTHGPTAHNTHRLQTTQNTNITQHTANSTQHTAHEPQKSTQTSHCIHTQTAHLESFAPTQSTSTHRIKHQLLAPYQNHTRPSAPGFQSGHT